MIGVSLRSLLSHKLRLALTTIAVILGVSFVAGTFILTDTLNSTFMSIFATANAGDARAEDALYLRAIAYARLGRSGSARNAARDYLARNPSGFRAPEMRTLAE